MNLDWLTTLLPIINATGIPILAIGIILLLRAYQKSVEAYKETSSHLREENERIRKRLNEADTFYFGEVEKMRTTVSNSMEAIKELQVRKISLLTQASEDNKETVLADIEKINEAIEGLREISTRAKTIDVKVREALFYLNHDFQELTVHVGELADQISDTKSRVAIVGVVSSGEALKELNREDIPSQGLTAPVHEKKQTSKILAKPNVLLENPSQFKHEEKLRNQLSNVQEKKLELTGKINKTQIEILEQKINMLNAAFDVVSQEYSTKLTQDFPKQLAELKEAAKTLPANELAEKMNDFIKGMEQVLEGLPETLGELRTQLVKEAGDLEDQTRLLLNSKAG
jgi:hypothetical protein